MQFWGEIENSFGNSLEKFWFRIKLFAVENFDLLFCLDVFSRKRIQLIEQKMRIMLEIGKLSSPDGVLKIFYGNSKQNAFLSMKNKIEFYEHQNTKSIL